jgi:hypothetical protein
MMVRLDVEDTTWRSTPWKVPHDMERNVGIRGSYRDGKTQVIPSFGSHNGGKTLRAAIIH